MKALVFRELKSVFCSPPGAFFSLAFLMVAGAMLWFFSGSYNLIDSGYADMGNFFSLAAMLFAILIPALTMRLFAEEKRNKTLYILRVRPISMASVYLSKFIATFVFVLVTLLPTLIYVYTLYTLANPVGNIDLHSIAASYISLLLLVAVFIAIGLFSSTITKNQIVALIISLVLCLFSFYGFELLAGMFLSGKSNAFVSSLGLFYHYNQMQRGVIQLSDMAVIVNYLILFVSLALFVLTVDKKALVMKVMPAFIIFNIIIFIVPNLKYDFTQDKRYTLSDYSLHLLRQVGEVRHPLKVDVYLTGDLNYGFQRLRDATDNLLADFKRYANGNLDITYINPYHTGEVPTYVYESMAANGMEGIQLNETDREGKISRKIIYPYARIGNGSDTLTVPLLKNIMGNTAEENLNASIESLEFEFIDAIRLLQQAAPKQIAFIEGHGELDRVFVYDAEEILSKYYSVNRGYIGYQAGVLDGFDAVVIAGPLEKYTEAEKYILDQYIMSGGKMLWIVDGAYYSHEELSHKGSSPSIKNDVNLDDMLFRYGVRINSDLIQDRQCIATYVMTGDQSVLVPSYYQPLLMPSPDHPVTKNIRDVKAGFASSVDLVNNSKEVEKAVLLTSSPNAHLVKVPEPIDFEIERIQEQPDYFNQPFVPVAVSLEGTFNSAFAGRSIPDSVEVEHSMTVRSSPTRMIVVASSDIISNGIQGQGADSQVIPMGYDRVSQTLFGNRDFIANAVNWLTEDDGLTALRTKQQQMHLLNKKASFEQRDKYAMMNILIPVLFVLSIMGAAYLYRKRKYER